MKIAITIITIIIAVYFIFFRNQKSGLAFWKKAQNNPLVAYSLLLKNDAWYVADGINNSAQPELDAGEWDGPFYLNVPGIGLIKIYGRAGYYQESQKELGALL